MTVPTVADAGVKPEVARSSLPPGDWLLLALLPGTLTCLFYFGAGVAENLVIGCVTGLGCDAAVRWFSESRAASANRFGTFDRSALIPAILIALAVPPGAPWGVLTIAVGSAYLVAKHAFGGARNAVVNPAVYGYQVELGSHPATMASWPSPLATPDSFQAWIGTSPTLGRLSIPGGTADGVTLATPLDILRQNSGNLLVDLIAAHHQLGALAGVGWQQINIAFLMGGMLLLNRGIVSWHIPLSFLATLTLCALLFYDEGSSASGGSPVFHLLSGATMLGAFFLATEPNMSPTEVGAQWIYGALTGALVFALRVGGESPDGVAWAILAANLCAPLIEDIGLARARRHPSASSADRA